jgi:hypothetical protein
MRKILYSPALKLSNLSALERPAGARYLECIKGQGGQLVAKAWRTYEPRTFEVLVCLGEAA